MSCFIKDYGLSGAGCAAIEDSIMQKGEPVTAGSKILEGFVSPITATVVDKLLSGGFKIAGRTTMDEFGIPALFDGNPDAVSGAVAAVADGKAEFALCNDLFGTYRRQAAEAGLCYIHPTYGTVSRFGLIPMASSMDQIGVVCRDMAKGFELLSLIAGKDEGDGAMFPEKTYDYSGGRTDITVGIPDFLRDNEAVRPLAGKFVSADIGLKYFDVCRQVMYILACAEISNNINRYDGIKFGFRAPGYKGVDDLYVKTRTEGFGPETKLAAIMGSMVLSQAQYEPYYEKAMKLRRLIRDSLKFDKYDVIALPCEISGDSYENLSLYALAALAGLPSISFEYEGRGIQLIAGAKNENLLKSAWEVCKA